MKREDSEAWTQLEATFRAVYSEAARTGEAIGEAVKARLLREGYYRMKKDIKARQVAARKATAAREENRAEERREWDRIDATLGDRPRTERARLIVSRLQAEEPEPWPTERTVYDHLTRRARRKKTRK